jgi:hypothetical protein
MVGSAADAVAVEVGAADDEDGATSRELHVATVRAARSKTTIVPRRRLRVTLLEGFMAGITREGRRRRRHR